MLGNVITWARLLMCTAWASGWDRSQQSCAWRACKGIVGEPALALPCSMRMPWLQYIEDQGACSVSCQPPSQACAVFGTRYRKGVSRSRSPPPGAR